MPDLDEARLIERLRAIEALYARPGTDGERTAAEHARERILVRLRESAQADPPVEDRFSMADPGGRERASLQTRHRSLRRRGRRRGRRAAHVDGGRRGHLQRPSEPSRSRALEQDGNEGTALCSSELTDRLREESPTR